MTKKENDMTKKKFPLDLPFIDVDCYEAVNFVSNLAVCG